MVALLYEGLVMVAPGLGALVGRAAAAAAYDRAAALAEDPAVRTFLVRRRAALGGVGVGAVGRDAALRDEAGADAMGPDPVGRDTAGPAGARADAAGTDRTRRDAVGPAAPGGDPAGPGAATLGGRGVPVA